MTACVIVLGMAGVWCYVLVSNQNSHVHQNGQPIYQNISQSTTGDCSTSGPGWEYNVNASGTLQSDPAYLPSAATYCGSFSPSVVFRQKLTTTQFNDYNGTN